MVSVQGSMSRGLSVQESLSRGFLFRGVSVLGVSVQGYLCPEGSLSREISVHWGLCQGVVSVQESLCPGGVCPGGSLSGGVFVRETPVR